jgi:hypothetical protein
LLLTVCSLLVLIFALPSISKAQPLDDLIGCARAAFSGSWSLAGANQPSLGPSPGQPSPSCPAWAGLGLGRSPGQPSPGQQGKTTNKNQKRLKTKNNKKNKKNAKRQSLKKTKHKKIISLKKT